MDNSVVNWSVEKGQGSGSPRERSGPEEDSGGRIDAPDVSVLVLVTERPADLSSLYREYAGQLAALDYSFEFVFLFEPWYQDQMAELYELRETGEPIRVVRVTRGTSEAALLDLGSAETRGALLLTLPGYRRVEATCLSDLLSAIREGGDVAVARRAPRTDSWINRLQTRAFHLLLGALTGVSLQDVACGVRVVRRAVLEELPLYGDFYRFLPVFADHAGFDVREVDAAQHPEDRQTRIHRPGVYVRRLVDLLGVFFLTRFTYKPLRFFGLIGSVLTLAGAVILAVLFFQRVGGQGIADRPMLLLGVLLATLGVQTLALGLIGEIIVHFNAPGRRRYRVVEREDGD